MKRAQNNSRTKKDNEPEAEPEPEVEPEVEPEPELEPELEDAIVLAKEARTKSPDFYLNNSTMFIANMNKLLRKVMHDQESDKANTNITCESLQTSEFKTLTHQMLVTEYLNNDTPYRGILLYHLLGTGKTCTSIAIAEGIKKFGKRIIVLTPASLSMNFNQELKKCGDPLYKKLQWWVKKDGKWTSDNTKEGTNYDTLDGRDKVEIEETIDNLIETQYVTYNYNGNSREYKEFCRKGQLQNPLNHSVVIIDEAHNFVSRIINKLSKLKKKTSDEADERDLVLYNYLMDAVDVRIVMLSGTPILNYPHEIAVLFNILRGHMKTWLFELKERNSYTTDDFKKILQDQGCNNFDYIEYDKQTLTISKNPFGFVAMNDKTGGPIQLNKTKRQLPATKQNRTKKNVVGGGSYEGVHYSTSETTTNDAFEKKVTQILKSKGIDFKKKHKKPIICLPDDKDEFYKTFIDFNTRKMIHTELFQRRILGLTSYFRSAAETLLPRYEMNGEFIYHVVKCEMSDFQFTEYVKVRTKEFEAEKASRTKKKMDKDQIFDIPSSYRSFSRVACNFVFPEEVKRPYPTHVDYNDDEVAGDVVVEEEVEPDDYKQRLQVALDELDSPAYLNIDVLSTYSEKFSKILTNLLDPQHRGLHLLYSNYREVEGIEVLRRILIKNGFAEFKIHKSKDWTLSEEVDEEDITKPKFVLYTGSESAEKREVVRNIYNGTWENLPSALANELLERYPNKNLYGDVIKAIMITASGAEGINLRNTRYVHIVEPYWNMVRVEQVIGRARRICSHQDLPEEDRTIKVFFYMSSLSPSQRKSKAIQAVKARDYSKNDESVTVTTDEAIYEMAQYKLDINNQILDAVKSAAIDCNVHHRDSDTYQCFDIPHSREHQYLTIPDIERDKTYTIQTKKTELQMQEFAYPDESGPRYYYDKKTNNIYGKDDTDTSIGKMVNGIPIFDKTK